MSSDRYDFDAAWQKGQAALAAAKEADPWADCWYEDEDDEAFSTVVQERMTDTDAHLIRDWRMGRGLTWRGVAAEAYESLRRTWRVSWSMPEHQRVGYLVCEAAARRLGEDPSSEPWN